MHADGFFQAGQRSTSGQTSRRFPDMPEVGHPESYYSRRVHEADKAGDLHAREANKVGQYVTLALDRALTWEQKLKYFKHALNRHCQLPPYPDDEVWMFYKQLADLVRQYCGYEALRLASQEDDGYAARQNMGQTHEKISDDAEEFFTRLMGRGDECPDHITEADWYQLKLIRNQWI